MSYKISEVTNDLVKRYWMILVHRPVRPNAAYSVEDRTHVRGRAIASFSAINGLGIASRIR